MNDGDEQGNLNENTENAGGMLGSRFLVYVICMYSFLNSRQMSVVVHGASVNVDPASIASRVQHVSFYVCIRIYLSLRACRGNQAFVL